MELGLPQAFVVFLVDLLGTRRCILFAPCSLFKVAHTNNYHTIIKHTVKTIIVLSKSGIWVSRDSWTERQDSFRKVFDPDEAPVIEGNTGEAVEVVYSISLDLDMATWQHCEAF